MIIHVLVDSFVVFLLHFPHFPFFFLSVCVRIFSLHRERPKPFPFLISKSFSAAITVIVSGLSRGHSPVDKGTGEKLVLIAFDLATYCREHEPLLTTKEIILHLNV